MSATYLTSLTNNAQTITYLNTQSQTVTSARTMDVRVIVPDTPGNYPVVFYSHGHSANPAGTGSTNAKALADLGYIVVLPTHLDSTSNPATIRNTYVLENPASTLHRVADIKFAFDQLPTLMAMAPGYTANTATPVIAGHSHGSWTSYLLTGVVPMDPAYSNLVAGNPYGLTSLVDSRFKASMVLSPPGTSAVNDVGPGFDSQSWSNYSMPSLTITGTLDETALEPDYSVRMTGFELSPSLNKHAVILRDADHFDIGGFSATPAETTAIANAMDAFLDAYVRGQANRLLNPASVLDSNTLFSETLTRTVGIASGEIRGTAFADQLVGYATADTIFGFDGNDTLEGGAARDKLDGGNGADVLSGGSGNDLLIGGVGSDTMTGGTGFDLFSYIGPGNHGNDVITDFGYHTSQVKNQAFSVCTMRASTERDPNFTTQDRIDLRGNNYSFAKLGTDISVTQIGADTLVSFVGGNLAGTSIKLLNVSAGTIDAQDFWF